MSTRSQDPPAQTAQRRRWRWWLITPAGIVVVMLGIIFYLANCGFGMPFGMAAYRGDLIKVKRMLENDPELIHAFPDGATALHYAAAHGHLDVVKYLVANGADVTRLDERGRTAEAWARQNSQMETADYLKLATGQTRD